MSVAGISIVVALVTFGLLLIDSRFLRSRGRSFLAIVAFFLVRKGQRDLAATQLAPERTAASMRKDFQLVKEQVT